MVIMNDDGCILSKIFGEICKEEREKNNGVLPFTVMCILAADAVCVRVSSTYMPTVSVIRNGNANICVNMNLIGESGQRFDREQSASRVSALAATYVFKSLPPPFLKQQLTLIIFIFIFSCLGYF